MSTLKGRNLISITDFNKEEYIEVLDIAEEFEKLGIKVDITSNENRMLIHGGSIHGGVTVSAHHDHRMAMALAVMSLNADAPITIEDAESVAKSYPKFWDDWNNAL